MNMLRNFSSSVLISSLCLLSLGVLSFDTPPESDDLEFLPIVLQSNRTADYSASEDAPDFAPVKVDIIVATQQDDAMTDPSNEPQSNAGTEGDSSKDLPSQAGGQPANGGKPTTPEVAPPPKNDSEGPSNNGEGPNSNNAGGNGNGVAAGLENTDTNKGNGNGNGNGGANGNGNGNGNSGGNGNGNGKNK